METWAVGCNVNYVNQMYMYLRYLKHKLIQSKKKHMHAARSTELKIHNGAPRERKIFIYASIL